MRSTFRRPARGLMRMGRTINWRPVPGGERFASDVVNAAVADRRQLPLITTASRLYRLTPGAWNHFHRRRDSYLTSSLAYSMQMLPDGEIAVGTRKGGLVLLDPQGALDRILSSTANGLRGRLRDQRSCRSAGRRLARAEQRHHEIQSGAFALWQDTGLEGDVADA